MEEPALALALAVEAMKTFHCTFDLSTFEGALSAQRSLRQTNLEAKEIGDTIQKWGHKLQLVKQITDAAMAPLLPKPTESPDLNECIHGAVGPALRILEAMISIRELKTDLMGDPRDNLKGYLDAALRLEGYLSFVSENRPLAVGLLEEAVRVSNPSPMVDKYTIRRLQGCIGALGSKGNPDDGGELLDIAVKKLESSFMSILFENSLPRDLKVSSEIPQSKQAFVGIESLQMIAEFLKRNGRAQACLKLYWEVRIRTVKSSFQSMKAYYLNYNSTEIVHKLKSADVEGHVSHWLRLLEVMVRDLMWSEKVLCSEIFESFDKEVWMECFGKLAAAGGMGAIIQFGETIAVSQREPQKVFKLLDMFEGLENLKDDVENVFEGYGCMETRLRLRELQKQLAHSSCQVLLEFSKQVEEDSGVPADGSLLKISSYVINYLKFLVGEYRPVMVRVLEMEGGMENGEIGLSRTVGDVLGALERNLEGRSKGYTEPALAHLFLMNNYWYIFKRARDSELAFLGETWLKERRRCVNQHVLGYERQKWGPALVHLNREGLAASSGSRAGAKELFKQRLRAFNLAFDQIYETHQHWVISDDELRVGTFIKITQSLIPAYRSFVETFGHLLDSTGNGNRYMRYTPEQLEDLLADLFSEKPKRMSN